ncbi:tRNA uridine-5-carboxymethylaminomethyl(34) synthesis enzyme MnmG [Desulfovibrio sp. OttesenSCG-928-A18]|nr:tRNA uridine-5-carboxymethylaminomethyl(34) synthesis enzyme MnmG [Desulfovibrio sp. OttesenSCG-928-A18]
MRSSDHDLIIVGAGHAGCEAAMAAARLGLEVLLVSSNADRIGHLSCNPAVGGLGKGHMVREIDALGGCMGLWTDEAAIQARTLNATKGPAVRATRAQVDRSVYMAAVKRDLFAQPKIRIREEMAESLLTRQGRAIGIVTSLGQRFFAPAILLTTGTFLQGHIHIGDCHYPGGRRGDSASLGLSASLRELGLELGRFMTCTTPRVLTASVDFSKMEAQPGDSPAPRFSLRGKGRRLPQQLCYLTWTSARTHEIIAASLEHSPMHNGAIPGAGPRYCPSIEDKIARWPEKERHQIFVEPEGVDSPETYPNNVPTGLPLDVQIELLHSIPGLERCHVVRPGYAIEYDIIRPTQLSPALECKSVPGLWSAGQINGTSGYEEAAAQGLWAALNIAAALRGSAPFLPGRDKAYMAVLVDDLVTRGTNEPYRMFTSRAEHRLLLRESNADERLTPLGREHGLVSDAQWDLFSGRRHTQERLMEGLRDIRISPEAPVRALFESWGEKAPARALSLGELFRRPLMTQERLAALWPDFMQYPEDIRNEAETALRYAGYVERQEEMARRREDADRISLPPDLDYSLVPGLTNEAREKLSAIAPATLGQASRIPGVTPAAVSCIEIALKRLERARRQPD